MGFVGYRRLLPESMNETIAEICEPFCEPSNDWGYCQPPCLTFCSFFCPSQVPPPIPSIPLYHHPAKINKVLITSLVVLCTTFVLVCFLAAYVKFYAGPRRRARRSAEEERNESHDEFLDEDHGPVIDHPIWYINTVGLQPSVISSITVCKYKRGDGLVEGTDCSVCLSEFQEDETLRLLPKCSHAFHIPCIDTWLRSHTNCPLCRAPIVINTARAAATSSPEANSGSNSGREENSITVVEVVEESERERVGGNEELALESEGRRRCEDGIQPLRRSVSLDSLSAFKVSQALTNVPQLDSDGNSSERRSLKEEGSNREVIAKRVGGNQGLLRLLPSSSVGRSWQNGSSSSLKRSISCSGKFFMSRYSRNKNPALPL